MKQAIIKNSGGDSAVGEAVFKNRDPSLVGIPHPVASALDGIGDFYLENHFLL